MKKIFIYLVLLIFIFSCSSKTETNQNNLNDDENVLARLNEKYQNNLTIDDVCILRPKSFKDLILVGYRAPEKGCMGNVVFYKGEESIVSDIYQQVLLDNGWNEKEKREVLALNLVSEVLLKWVTPLYEEPKDFKSHESFTFMPPTTRIESGEIVVSIWVLEPAGISPVSSYYLFTAVFNSEAKMIRSQMTDRFSVNF